ncbi:XRE family transcriptional regulator [uncultured Paludibaculum sp.]|uniref:XRE family transcriptional regulator n=1 Tax=uncultured Paludibaculum sp. TaxID=1765020 RepID=UPI002AAAA326|nr:XRE family transcriptional regulator [uncultured Paludibaculum sp.]
MNPSRLRLARKRRQCTQRELAELAGLHERAVKAYEAGEYEPTMETMERIQAVLKFPAEFFEGDDLEEPLPDAASFRALTKMSARQRDAALSQGALALHLNKWFERRFELPAASLPDLSDETSPEAASETLRATWGLGELTIRNMIHLLEAKGVRVYSLAVNAREVDAFSMWKGTTPFIFLNCYKSSERSRFDAAHELGHLVLHRQGVPQGPEAEREANRFASAFLMPSGSIHAHVPLFPTVEELVKIKRVWITSVAAVNHRFHELGLIRDWHYRRLCVEIAKRGFRSAEPEEAPRETSLLVPKLLAALQQEGISRARIAAELGIPIAELRELLFGLAMTDIDGGRTEAASRGPGATQPGLHRIK